MRGARCGPRRYADGFWRPVLRADDRLRFGLFPFLVKPGWQPFREDLVYLTHPIAMGTLRARPGNRSQLILTGGVLSAILSVLSFLLAYIVL